MRFDGAAPPGEPFADDYPGHRHDQTCAPFHEYVSRQVSELAGRGRAPAARRDILATLQRRRVARDRDLLQFDVLFRDEGFDHLLVGGELLLTSSAYRAPEVAAILDSQELRRAEFDCPELADRVVRVRNPELSASTLDAVARRLRGLGHSASVDHVMPLAPVIKGIGGAKPAVGPGPFTGYRPRPAGKPVTVGVIDCGITAEIRSDGWLNAIPRNGNIDPLDELPNPDGYLDLGAGHGTFVSGIIAQVAPGANIRVYRALDGDGIGSELQVAAAMVRAVKDDGCQVLNLSLGGQTPDNVPPVAVAAALDVIAEIERKRGAEVVIVAAAGNYGDDLPCWPAAFSKVVAVAGLDPGLRPTEWSSRGDWVDCAAIGQGLCSTFVAGRESSVFDPNPDVFPPDAWAVWNGTSFAAPQVVGAIARLSQETGIAVQAALARLLRAGRPVPGFGQALRILPGL
jgi:hypothetical protein